MVYFSPEGRRFRSRTEIKAFVEENPQLKLSEQMFDFSIYRRRRVTDHSKRVAAETSPLPEVSPTTEPEEEPGTNLFFYIYFFNM